MAYAWEPVIIKAARKPIVGGDIVSRDWIQESITMKRGFTGAKPERVCHWAFNLVGAQSDDFLDDMFIGSGAVTRAWETWRNQLFNRPVEETEDEKEERINNGQFGVGT